MGRVGWTQDGPARWFMSIGDIGVSLHVDRVDAGWLWSVRSVGGWREAASPLPLDDAKAEAVSHLLGVAGGVVAALQAVAAERAAKAVDAVVWQTVDVTVAVKAGEPFTMKMVGAGGWVMCMDSDGRWGVTHAPTGLRLTTLPCPIQALAVVQALAVNAPLPEAPPSAGGETAAWGASVTRRVSDVLRGVSATCCAACRQVSVPTTGPRPPRRSSLG